MAPVYCFSATGYVIVSCWPHYRKDCTVCGISRKEQLSLIEFRASVIVFFASRKKRVGRKQKDLAYIGLMLKLKWKRERSQMQQCQKGKLQEIEEDTYHGSPRRGDISRNPAVLLYRQSTAPNVRILCASQSAHNACRLSKELDYLVRKL